MEYFRGIKGVPDAVRHGQDEGRSDEAYRQLDAAWNRFCENCGERLEEGSGVWVHVLSGGPDDAPVEVFYCHKCIKVDPDRTRETHGPSRRS